MVRKRASGAGRKPQGSISGLTSAVNLRMPDDLRAMLDTARAKSGESLTQEVLQRLYDSFRRDREEERDPITTSLSYLLARAIIGARATMRTGEWTSFAWRTVQLTFDKLMERNTGAGEIVATDNARPQLGQTPEQVATFLATAIVLELETADEEKPGAMRAAQNLLKPKGK